LQPGRVRLRCFQHSYYEHWTDPIDMTGQIDEVQQITLLGANEIRVTVVDEAGTPRPGANVSLSRPSTDDPDSRLDFFNVGETDAKGRKIVNFHWIRHYQIVARHGGRIAFTNFANMREVNVREFTLQLEPASTISGRVVSQTSGQPVGNV